jgi:hypothetical protein
MVQGARQLEVIRRMGCCSSRKYSICDFFLCEQLNSHALSKSGHDVRKWTVNTGLSETSSNAQAVFVKRA